MANPETTSAYDPLKDPEYMSQQMLRYFRDKLIKLRQDILTKERGNSFSMGNTPFREPDYVDQGTMEGLHHGDFALQKYEDQVRHKVEAALARFHEGTFGYCEETGEAIGVQRLLAVPYACYSLKVQNHKENQGKGLIKAG